MHAKVFALLKARTCFEEVATALRGPDDENLAEKELTAVLRWTVGFNYGTSHAPTKTFWEEIRVSPRKGIFSSDPLYSHFRMHTHAAFDSLERLGWTPSRIPLRAYLDQGEVTMEALDILRNAAYYLNPTGRPDEPASNVLNRLYQEILRLPPDSEEFHLSLAKDSNHGRNSRS